MSDPLSEEVKIFKLTVIFYLKIGIDLNNNQWLCDCKLVDFHQWLTLYNVPQIFDPKCHRPLRLKNHEIRTILKGDLACLPEVSPTAFYLETGEGKNISLNCKVIANPPAEITWWFQGRPLVLQVTIYIILVI